MGTLDINKFPDFFLPEVKMLLLSPTVLVVMNILFVGIITGEMIGDLDPANSPPWKRIPSSTFDNYRIVLNYNQRFNRNNRDRFVGDFGAK